MSKALCTYCSAIKNDAEEPLPAIDRYISERIKSVHEQSEEQNCQMIILSGKFGLLRPGDPIPWYDHLLLPDEVDTMIKIVAGQIKAYGITELEYHTAPLNIAPAVRPYYDTIRMACVKGGAKLSAVELDGDIP
jgi:hypothetical protein